MPWSKKVFFVRVAQNEDTKGVHRMLDKQKARGESADIDSAFVCQAHAHKVRALAIVGRPKPPHHEYDPFTYKAFLSNATAVAHMHNDRLGCVDVQQSHYAEGSCGIDEHVVAFERLDVQSVLILKRDHASDSLQMVDMHNDPRPTEQCHQR